MKLTKNSWHYNAYLFLTGKTPNNNFCDYFWELLFNVLFFIPNIPFYLITIVYSKYEKVDEYLHWDYIKDIWTKKPKSYKEKLIANNKLPLFFKLFCSLVLYLLFISLIIALTTNLVKLLLVILVLIGVGICLYGIIYFFTESTTKDKIVDNVTEIKDVAVEGFNSFKNNYCPRITWEDKN